MSFGLHEKNQKKKMYLYGRRACVREKNKKNMCHNLINFPYMRLAPPHRWVFYFRLEKIFFSFSALFSRVYLIKIALAQRVLEYTQTVSTWWRYVTHTHKKIFSFVFVC